MIINKLFYHGGTFFMRILLNKIFATVVVLFLGTSSFVLNAAELLDTVDTGEDTWEVYQLTNNNTWDQFPITRNGGIVWKGSYNGSGDLEILFWDGKDTTYNISDNGISSEYEPSFDGRNIYWRTFSSNGDGTYTGNIYACDGQLIASYNLGTYNPGSGYPPSWHSLAPTTHNGYVTWAAYDGNDYEIFLWKDGETTQITDNDTHDYEPQVYNGQISFTGEVNGIMDVYFWNGASIENISNSSATYQKNQDSHLWDGKIVWSGWVSGSGGNKGAYEIFYYDGANKTQISSYGGGRHSFEPVLFENEIAWHWWDGNDWEILFYDGNQITQMTNNEVGDLEVSLHENMLSWHRFKEGNGPTEIMYAIRKYVCKMY